MSKDKDWMEDERRSGIRIWALPPTTVAAPERDGSTRVRPATPLPWKLNQRWSEHNNAAQIDGPNVSAIAGGFYLGGTDPAQRNAAYIVHACNKYQEMVAVLLSIAKPALGGKAQQRAAQAILRELGEL